MSNPDIYTLAKRLIEECDRTPGLPCVMYANPRDIVAAYGELAALRSRLEKAERLADSAWAWSLAHANAVVLDSAEAYRETGKRFEADLAAYLATRATMPPPLVEDAPNPKDSP